MNQVQIQILPEEKNLLLFIQPKNKETENEQLSIKPQSITGRSDRSTTTRRLQVSAENVPDHVSNVHVKIILVNFGENKIIKNEVINEKRKIFTALTGSSTKMTFQKFRYIVLRFRDVTWRHRQTRPCSFIHRPEPRDHDRLHVY